MTENKKDSSLNHSWKQMTLMKEGNQWLADWDDVYDVHDVE